MSLQLASCSNTITEPLESLQTYFSQLAALHRQHYAYLRSQGSSLTDSGSNGGFAGEGAESFTNIVTNYCNVTEKLMKLLDQLDTAIKTCCNEIASATSVAVNKIMSATNVLAIGYLEEQLVSHVLESLTLNDIILSGASAVQVILNRLQYSWQDIKQTGGNFFGHPIQAIDQMISGGMRYIEISIDHLLCNLEQALSQWAQSIYNAIRTCKQVIGSLTSQINTSSSLNLNGLGYGDIHLFPPSNQPSHDPHNPFQLKKDWYGECTWWTAERIYQLTGKWVPMRGNAKDWINETKQGWHISNTPTVGSILVLGPNTQGCYGLGHVAVIEQVLQGGWVLTSNMNWPDGSKNVTFLKFRYPYPNTSIISPP